jgi:hypothetical protein
MSWQDIVGAGTSSCHPAVLDDLHVSASHHAVEAWDAANSLLLLHWQYGLSAQLRQHRHRSRLCCLVAHKAHNAASVASLRHLACDEESAAAPPLYFLRGRTLGSLQRVDIVNVQGDGQLAVLVQQARHGSIGSLHRNALAPCDEQAVVMCAPVEKLDAHTGACRFG